MSTQNQSCQFQGNYRNLENNQNVDYFCDRMAHAGSTLCEFHDPDFLESATDTQIDQLRIELLSVIEFQTSHLGRVELIGFHLPDIDFTNMIFQRPLYFSGTTFHGNCNFSTTRFHNVADFSRCHVHGDSIFTGSRFELDANFFHFTQEGGTSSFQNITFKGKTNFSHAVFLSGLFSTGQFHEITFKSATFDGTTEFWDSVFHSRADFTSSHFNGLTNFRDVIFENQKLVSFDGQLNNVSFIGTDITRIRFGEKTIWGLDDRFDIYDANQLRQNPSQYNLGDVLAVYRNLRENYEFRLKYEEAGKCFVKEMQLRRYYEDDPDNDYQAKERCIIRKYASATSFYSYLCEYGENLRRPAIYVSIIFALAFSFFFHFPEAEIIKEYSLSNPINYTTYLEHEFENRTLYTVERSLSSFIPFILVEKSAIPDLLVKIASIPILGTLFIVLRRRFERRFRH